MVEPQAVRGPWFRPELPHPAAGCPFITKAHGTLTRRPGGSSVSVSRVRRRPAYHRPNRVRRGGSRRPRVSQVASSREAGSGSTDPEGLRSRGSTRGRFQRGSSCEPLPPRVPGHCQPPRPRFASRSAPSARHLSVRGYRRSSGLSTRDLPSFRTIQRLQPVTPPRLRARCARGFGGPFRHPINEWLVQLSGPCSAL